MDDSCGMTDMVIPGLPTGMPTCAEASAYMCVCVGPPPPSQVTEDLSGLLWLQFISLFTVLGIKTERLMILVYNLFKRAIINACEHK